MDKYANLLKKVKEINNPLKKKIFFLSVLTKALSKEKPVIVGGCALEFYSTGGYTTGDIDIIYSDSKLVAKKLEKWGFSKKGRHWLNEELDILLEIAGSYLSDDEEKRITIVEIEGLKIYLISIEDLIIDRLNAFVHWKSSDDGYWAKELFFIYGKKLDLKYLYRRCSEEETLDDLKELIKELESVEDEKS